MRVTCLITNYNYGAYLSQAVDSALSQTRPFDEIIIVDDASTDNSSAVLSELAKRSSNIRIVHKRQNAGQLAAFETGVMQSTGDIISFLDADDLYSPDYLDAILAVYEKHPTCDCLFCSFEQFSDGSSPKILAGGSPIGFHPEITDFGLTVVRTLERKLFIGAPTSCLSFRRWLAMRLFPLPLHEDWRTRADDCLVFGTSIAGARKFRIGSNLVGYRIHGKNAYALNSGIGKPGTFLLRQIALMRLFNLLSDKFNVQRDQLNKLAHLEFKTIPNPTGQDLFEYISYVLKNGAQDAGRLGGVGVILKWYFKAKLAASRAASQRTDL